MTIRDLRGYIEALASAGELHLIDKEVDWDIEAGLIAARANETGAPAPLFTRIKGYPHRYSLLGSPLSGSRVKGDRPWRRFAIALGMDPSVSFWDLIEEYIKRKRYPLKPTVLSWGSCKENIQLGKEVDLFKLPIPFIHEGDGGRYSSWHAFINKDPDSDWTNWGLYRWMVHTGNRLGIQMLPGQHGPMLYYLKYENKDKPMPFCIALGGDPLITIAASIPLPAGVNEIEIAGGLRRAPMELVKAETVDIYVPTMAEIVIEGEIYPHERWDEGPFAEYHSYKRGPRMPAPVGRVSAITHRDNPILPFSSSGPPVDDYATTSSVTTSGDLLYILRDKNGWPVRGVYCPPDCIDNLVIISATMIYSYFSRQLAAAVWGSKPGMVYNKVIVCDADVDPADRETVFHNFCHKNHPYRGVRKFDSAPGYPTQQYLSTKERQDNKGAQVYFDCTWPLDWDPETEIVKQVSFETNYPKEIQELVLQRWKEYYGYPTDSYEI